MAANTMPILEKLTKDGYLIISEGSADLFRATVSHLAGHPDAEKMFAAPKAANDDDFWPKDENDWRARYRPYEVDANGTLQIPVMGVLLHRFPYQFGGWATGYTYIEKAMVRGLADTAVKRIAFIIDSPGGHAAGCFELGDKIYDARGEKPMQAFASDHAYSAAYAIASSVGKISVTRSGGVGSIGVVTSHVDYSGALEKAGVKVTFIFAGKHKVDGNPYEKLSPTAKARMQKRIDALYEVFTSTVSRNRKMDEQAVIDTEALTYPAKDAVEIGLADKVGELEDEIAIFNQDSATEEEIPMANENQNTVDKATHDAAVAQARAEGVAEGTKAGAVRVKAILESDEGKKRPTAALAAALNSDMSVEQASAFLSSLAEEKAEAPKPQEQPQQQEQQPKPQAKGTPFEQHMDASGNPDVGAHASEPKGTEPTNDDLASSILSSFAAGTGKKYEPAKQ